MTRVQRLVFYYRLHPALVSLILTLIFCVSVLQVGALTKGKGSSWKAMPLEPSGVLGQQISSSRWHVQFSNNASTQVKFHVSAYLCVCVCVHELLAWATQECLEEEIKRNISSSLGKVSVFSKLLLPLYEGFSFVIGIAKANCKNSLYSTNFVLSSFLQLIITLEEQESHFMFILLGPELVSQWK